jgi:predicted ArsR family transcriptional regulator
MLKLWLQDLLTGLQDPELGDMGVKLLEKCGRACARRGFAVTVQQYRKSVAQIADVNERLDRLGQVWDKLKREGGNTYVVYNECLCPLRKDAAVKSAFFCNCSRGWVKEIFELILERPVQVELKQAISKGDSECRFQITW